MLLVLLVIAASAVASWLTLAALIHQLRHRLLDQPNSRSSHTMPIPRGGGLSFVTVSSAAAIVSIASVGFTNVVFLTLLVVPLSLVGLLDDRHSLPAWTRFVVQLATATGMMLFSPLPVPLWAMLLLLISVVAVINFINFMDGLDGLVAGCMVVVFAISAVLVSPAFWPLTGALLGYLPWNWSPAKVFMGDVGSTYLGALFAGAVMHAPTWPHALGLLLVATPLLGDACICVVRRLVAGQRVFQPHRLHVYQRLHQAGWSHARVSALYVTATILLAFTLLFAGWIWVSALASVVLLCGFWIDRTIAIPFALSSTGFKG